MKRSHTSRRTTLLAVAFAASAALLLEGVIVGPERLARIIAPLAQMTVNTNQYPQALQTPSAGPSQSAKPVVYCSERGICRSTSPASCGENRWFTTLEQCRSASFGCPESHPHCMGNSNPNVICGDRGIENYGSVGFDYPCEEAGNQCYKCRETSVQAAPPANATARTSNQGVTSPLFYGQDGVPVTNTITQTTVPNIQPGGQVGASADGGFFPTPQNFGPTAVTQPVVGVSTFGNFFPIGQSTDQIPAMPGGYGKPTNALQIPGIPGGYQAIFQVVADPTLQESPGMPGGYSQLTPVVIVPRPTSIPDMPNGYTQTVAPNNNATTQAKKAFYQGIFHAASPTDTSLTIATKLQNFFSSPFLSLGQTVQDLKGAYSNFFNCQFKGLC